MAITLATVIEILNFLNFHRLTPFAEILPAITLAPLAFLFGIWLYYKRQRKRLGNLTIALADNAIYASSASGDGGHTEWKNVASIIQKFGAIIVQVSSAPTFTYWIPMRSFQSRYAADSFFARAHALWHAAQNEPAVHTAQIAEGDASLALIVDMSFRDLLLCNFLLGGKWLVLLSLVMFSLAGINLGLLPHGTSSGSIFLDVSFGLWLLGLWPYGAWRLVSKRPDWLRARLSINDAGITSAGAGYNNTYSWQTVQKIESRSSAIVFYMPNRRALYIPFRNLSSTEQRERFCDTAQDYWQKAHGAKQ